MTIVIFIIVNSVHLIDINLISLLLRFDSCLILNLFSLKNVKIL